MAMNQWKLINYRSWALVSEDGEILDRVDRHMDGTYRVQSTNKSYVTELAARVACEIKHNRSEQ